MLAARGARGAWLLRKVDARETARIHAAIVLFRRGAHDLRIREKTGLPRISYGTGGRHSVSGQVATVFGATGFLGRYLVQKLARAGTQVVCPIRDEYEWRHLKLMGDLGIVQPLEWDIRNDVQIEECLRHSDVVYNLVGRDWETKNFSFDDVHVEGARRIAFVAQRNNVSRLIHVSHFNQDLNSPSKYYHAKAAGEEAVRDAFPEATIVRPSQFYGHEDRFLNKMPTHPWSWRLNHGGTMVQPVHVLDLAEALATMSTAEQTIGETFELTGPRAYTHDELLRIVQSITLKKVPEGNMPYWLLAAISRVTQYVWWAVLSPDEVRRRRISDKERLSPGVKTWQDLGMEPSPLEANAVTYLRRYRAPVYQDALAFQHGMGSEKTVRRTKYYVVD